MEIIKSYTDLEQSRKLAELLPLKSADMYYSHEFVNSAGDYYKLNIASEGYFDEEESLGSDIPAWSLAALLDVLPEGTRLLKSTNISSVGDVKYHCDCPKVNIDKWYDNPIDACVAMVERLHELNLL